MLMHPKSLLNNTRVAICAIFKNEEPYILEWIAHHRLIGITDFYIADNISTDGSSELLDLLNDNGLITRISWPTIQGIKPQLPAYQKLVELSKNDGVDWALFIDADEFIILDDNIQNIQSAIENITNNDESVSGIALNWATYGSSNMITNPGNNVLGNFEFRFKKDSSINRHYKSLIKIKDFVSPGSTPHEFKIGETCKYINTAGVELSQPLSGMSDFVTWDNMKIHHYMIKSKSEYVSKKMKKGRASSSANLDMSYFNAHDVNHEHAPLKRSWISSVKCFKRKMQDIYPSKNKGNNIPLYFKHESGHIGVIDSFRDINHVALEINGWALSQYGHKPHSFRVIVNEYLEFPIKLVTFKHRPDVFRTIEICKDEYCGFTILCDIPTDENIKSVSVYHGTNPIVSTGLINSQSTESL